MSIISRFPSGGGGGAAAALDSLVMTAPPDQLEYTAHELIRLTGARFEARYSDGAARAVALEAVRVSPWTAKPGVPVTASYTEAGATRSVDVGIAVAEGAGLVLPESANVGVTFAVNADAPWTYSEARSDDDHSAYIAGNSGTRSKGISNLSLTVRGTGILRFDWRVNTSPLYAMLYRWGGAVTEANRTDCPGSIKGNPGWSSVELDVTEDLLRDGEAALYLAYWRGGTVVTGGNYAAIANVSFTAGP